MLDCCKCTHLALDITDNALHNDFVSDATGVTKKNGSILTVPVFEKKKKKAVNISKHKKIQE